LNSNRYFFITGTDTGVGKTLFTLALGTFLKNNNIKYNLIKPIETGCTPLPEDGVLYQKYLFPNKEINKIVPFQYQLPASPYISAKIERKEIEFANLLKSITTLPEDIILIEGAGGLMVPINKEKTFLDIVIEIQPEVFIVAANKLGVINHTLLTCKTLLKYGLQGKIILNDIYPEKNEVSETNMEQLQLFSNCEILGRLPYFSGEINRKELIGFIEPLANNLKALF